MAIYGNLCSADPILRGLLTQLPIAVLRLRLSEMVGHSSTAERDVLLLPVLGLLQQCLYLDEEKQRRSVVDSEFS